MYLKLSIKWKVTFLVVILVLVSATLLGVTNYYNSRQVLEEELRSSSENMVGVGVTLLDNTLQSVEEDLQTLANLDDFRSGHNEELIQGITSYVEATSNIPMAYFASSDGKITSYPHVDLDEDFDPTSRTWYQGAEDNTEIFWTEPYIDENDGNVVVTASTSVYDDGGDFLGVIGVDLDFERLSDYIAQVQIGEQGYLAIANTEGMLLTHPDPKLLGEVVPVPGLLEELSNTHGGYDYEHEGDRRFTTFNTLDRAGWKVLGIVSHQEIVENTSFILLNSFTSGVIILTMAIAIGIGFSFTITKPLTQLVKDVQNFGDGDFTVRCKVNSKDEVGVLSSTINETIIKLGNLINSIKNVSEELNQSSENLAANSEETTASSQEVTKAVEEIAKGANEQAADGQQSASLTMGLAEKFGDMQKANEEMLKLTEDVKKANKHENSTLEGLNKTTEDSKVVVDKISHAIASLNEKTNSIGDILEVINSISQQTNLLALNAAIEAARAGEAGKGFAVVAEEIRKLADQTGQSTEKIQQIVQDISTESNNSVEIMEGLKEESQQQAQAVMDMDGSVRSITTAVDSISSKINEIASFASEMQSDNEEIVEVIEKISSVSQQTAASTEEVNASMEQTSQAVEEVTKAAEGLNTLAERLQGEVKKFRV
ncbi:methyl-accepting chemotaxis protein [Proteinivorax tanatarense]|uniref:Methyl-accepting chemotaxis protein n=1 Tax=Proteinivorax tanatarense TaxID=1260629 RepID=A0AAU7VP17_9FIRM